MDFCKAEVGVNIPSVTLSYLCPRHKLIKMQNLRLSLNYTLAELLERQL